MKALRIMAVVMMTAMVSVCMVACGGSKNTEAPAEAVENCCAANDTAACCADSAACCADSAACDSCAACCADSAACNK